MANQIFFKFVCIFFYFLYFVKLITYMRVKLTSRAQFYVKDIFGRIFNFFRNMRENKEDESFLGFTSFYILLHTYKHFFLGLGHG